MSASVIHQPRVAWDAARAFVSMAGAADTAFAGFSARVDSVLGPQVREALLNSRRRLLASTRSDATMVEVARWRVSLEDLLRARPDVADGVLVLTHEAGTH